MDRAAVRSVGRDAEAMSRFVRDDFERGTTRGLAMFSSHAAGLWDVVRVPRPLMSRSVVGPVADVLPLEVVLETYRRSAVVLVDSQAARLSVVQMGELEGVTADAGD